MLDMSTLTKALATKLATVAATVKRSGRINFDPSQCPWVGIYPDATASAPRTASGGAQWKDDAGLQVVVQTASLDGEGTNASDALEALIQSIANAVNVDLTLGVTGVRVVGMSREYRYVVFDDDGLGELFMPQAVIKLKLEVRSN